MPLIAIQFARFGPYHLARINSARLALSQIGWDVVGVETAGSDTTYEWREEAGPTSWRRVTVFPGEASEAIPSARLARGMRRAIEGLRPDAVAIAGWSSPDSRACLAWCRKNGAKAIVMSETREADGLRVWWKEWIKRFLISRFDCALVGGESHRNYLVKLGMSGEKIEVGYNVVDNAYFTSEALKHRRGGIPVHPYFLASNRFIERKNLSRLVVAYGSYVHRCQQFRSNGQESAIWDLCLLGDGMQKSALMAQCYRLGLDVQESAPWDSDHRPETPKDRNTVFFPGFRQIDELPPFFAHAGCFVHPALEEPWGLVINEAMSCGLPVLSSDNVGAAEELVVNGVNGWKFAPSEVEPLAELMLKVSACGSSLASFGEASRRILDERAPTSAFGEGLLRLLQ